jgi:hypothetical protein
MFNSIASLLVLGYVTAPLPPGTYTEPVKPGINRVVELSTDQQCSREGNAGHPTCRYH